MKSRIMSLAVALLALAGIAAAQQRPLKILVLYDMEGVSEATDFKHTSFAYPAEYALGRKSLTADVNAAIAGLKAAGATEIVIVDGHGSGNSIEPDVIESQLLAPARIGYKDVPFDHYMESYDHSFDAVVAVGMHAAAGNSVGFLSHTRTFEDIEFKVNSVPFNESMIFAAGAARMKIPLIMVSGDDQLEREIRREMPWVRYANVKHAVDRATAVTVGRDEASRRIESAARDALQHLTDMKLPQWNGPFRFALTFQDEAQATNALMLPGSEAGSGPAVVQIRAADFEEGYFLSGRLIGLASAVGRADARTAVINAQPNAVQLRADVAERLYNRFLDRLPSPPAVMTTTKPRYWGAR